MMNYIFFSKLGIAFIASLIIFLNTFKKNEKKKISKFIKKNFKIKL